MSQPFHHFITVVLFRLTLWSVSSSFPIASKFLRGPNILLSTVTGSRVCRDGGLTRKDSFIAMELNESIVTDLVLSQSPWHFALRSLAWVSMTCYYWGGSAEFRDTVSEVKQPTSLLRLAFCTSRRTQCGWWWEFWQLGIYNVRHNYTNMY
jgi:hypothetical protein